ncbi:adenylate cyclase [Micrococcales bacterium KH10]|nr:adenylate cyclase [Micrococcales bacterium KH10]
MQQPDESGPDEATQSDGRAIAARLDHEILGESRELTATELAAVADVDEEFARNYWRALGLPIAARDRRAFTPADAEAVHEMAETARERQWDIATVSTLVRSVGHTMDRLALWQLEALADHIMRTQGISDAAARTQTVDSLPDLMPMLQTQLLHAWRRQLAAWASRYAIEFSDTGPQAGDAGALPMPRAVGFVDIVQFTQRTTALESRELASFVQNFEATCRDIVTAHGGRVVKTIGDAVLFITDDAAAGADVALALAQQWQSPQNAVDGEPLAVRISLVWGRVLSRFGDVFGPSVNLAARLASASEPGQILIDEATREALQVSERFSIRQCAVQSLPGIGEVPTWALDPAL